jgi:hypothetical protein
VLHEACEGCWGDESMDVEPSEHNQNASTYPKYVEETFCCSRGLQHMQSDTPKRQRTGQMSCYGMAAQVDQTHSIM